MAGLENEGVEYYIPVVTHLCANITIAVYLNGGIRTQLDRSGGERRRIFLV